MSVNIDANVLQAKGIDVRRPTRRRKDHIRRQLELITFKDKLGANLRYLGNFRIEMKINSDFAEMVDGLLDQLLVKLLQWPLLWWIKWTLAPAARAIPANSKPI